MNRKQKIQLTRIIIAGILLAAGSLLSLPPQLSFTILMISYLTAGYDTLWTAIRNICHGQVFDENFLMAIATIGALALQDYSEAVFVMLFYLVGTLFEEYAVNKSRGSIAQLMDIRPDSATLLKEGKETVVDPYDVAIGDTIIVKPGEKVPLDGTILTGSSSLDTSALTGESLPRDVAVGQEITSGCINLTGVLTIKVSSEFDDSTVSKILDMVENAGNKKAKVEKFITKFARYYTPIVVIVAAVMAIVPPLLIPGQLFSDWISRALIFLVISCPCALVISVPLAFFGGVGGASRCGILVKGSNYLEALANVNTVIFDKTGTLTTGTFQVSGLHPVSCTEEELLHLAAYAESYSDHPVALCIRQAYPGEIDKSSVSEVEEIAGKGLRATVGDTVVHAGNDKLMNSIGITDLPTEESSTLIHISSNRKYCGYVAISDTVKEDAAAAVSALKAAGVKSTVMLSGDRKAVVSKVSQEIGLDRYYAELLPGDKVSLAEKMISEKSGGASRASKGAVAYVGDGINDAPVLARADIGVAMGGLGSEAAIEAADIVIMDDQPSKLPVIMKIARKTLMLAKQNVVFALSIKAIVLVLGALGMASMWAAVFADVGVAVIAILNSMRALQVSRWVEQTK